MKKKVIKYISLFSIIIYLVVVFLISLYFYDSYKNYVMKDVKNDCYIFAGLISSDNPVTEIENLNSGLTRVTLIASNGKVLADTDSEFIKMENHLSRQEIASAVELGEGDAIRKSESTGRRNYYFAIKLSDGNILRSARQLDSFFMVFSGAIPFVILIMIFIMIISFFVSAKLTEKLIRPINSAAAQLDGVFSGDFVEQEILSEYDELLPFVRKIRYLNKEIHNYVKQLKAQSNTLNTITQNMQEGLILLDRELNILSVNSGARTLLKVSTSVEFSGKSLISLCRNHEITEKAKEAFDSKTNCFFDHVADGEYLKYFFSPVLKESGNVWGLVIFIVNASAEIKSQKSRRDFASNVSHELKTPLTSISGFAEMLKNSMIAPEDVQKTAKLIHREASRMITLINDIMRLSQIEGGAFVTTEPVSLSDTASEVISSLSTLANEREISFKTQLEPIFINVNPSMLYELIFNLCENAVKYNKPCGEVSITIVSDYKNAIITVSDTGIGIPKEYFDRIFERFYRVDKSRSKQTGGTGLGLSIVKHSVEALNGTLDLSSEIGKGTTITVTIPIEQQSFANL